MSSRIQSPIRVSAIIGAIVLAIALLGGCTVIAIAATTASMAASGVGLAADAAVGTVRLTGKAVSAVLPGGAE